MKSGGYRRAWPERVDPSRRKPRRRESTMEEDQGHAFSLETLAGEFIVMASLRA